MSYLDLPRLQFSGLFFTAPSTINNDTVNYIPSTQLETGDDQFNPQVVGWNPNGVAQWWLEECAILSGVGKDGKTVTSNGDDGVIGAAVVTPSPSTPLSDGAQGFYDIAKMVDLDPDQQGRSAVYGARLSVTLPNGAGFQGLMTVPELRQLNGRVAGARSSYGAVGTWMGVVQNVAWSGDVSGSKLLSALKSTATAGLAIKLTVDLHQNNPANQFTAGDIFCYGRVLGTIGPALPGELAQVVPGRCLQTFTPSAPPAPPAAAAPMTEDGQLPQGRDRMVAKTAAMTAAAEEAVALPPRPWNPAYAIVRGNFLHVDIGGCMFLQSTGSGRSIHSDGKFVVEDGIEVGVRDPGSGNFTAFTNGAISFTNLYQTLTSNSKNCELVTNSAVFTIPLTTTDANNAQATPLAIAVNGVIVAAEFANGYWMDFSVDSQRLQCGGANGQCQIMVRKFGKPVAGQAPPVTTTVQLFEWVQDPNGNWTNPSSLPDSTAVGVTFGNTDANGIANVTVTVNVTTQNLPGIRQPLDSYIYYISMTDPDGNPIGDGFTNANITVLLWNPFQAPSTPTWADVGPVLASYARLYPGMKSILDIGDESTVTGFAPVLLGRMSAPFLDPAFMPVTRDLSPTKTDMVLTWLKSVVA